MGKRVFIVHGWGGYPEEGWFPWLKKELEDRGFEVSVPSMPNTEKPMINEWVSHLQKEVGESNEETYFVGHSIGCQTILRYFESLEKNEKVGGAVFVAGFVKLNLDAIEKEEPGSSEIAIPWFETPISWDKIKNHTKKFIAIFSDNDIYVSMNLDNNKIFQEKLNAKIIIEKGKGHFSGADNITKLPSVLNSISEMSK